jgi:prepilin-type N-terminal cleavage/methylation domain-containing protein
MNKKGFTLIEVLTVIMIIAILASIVLVSLQTARDRTKDVTIQNQIGQLRSLAEALYTFENGYEDFREAVEGSGTEASKYTLVSNKISEMDGSLSVNISTDNSAYCAYSSLVRDASKTFCVDSTGNAVVSTGTGCATDNFTCEDGSGGSSGCSSNADCSSPRPYCNTSTGSCVECLSSGDCSFGYVCDGGDCVED